MNTEETTTAAPPDEGLGFNADTFAAGLKAEPMEDTGAGKQPEPAAAPGAEQTPPAPDAPPAQEEEDAGRQAKRSAKFILDMFDRLQANIFSTVSITETPERFRMTNEEKKEAAEYLAQGIEESGTFSVPWYIPLTVVLGISAWTNWQRAKRARDQYEADLARQEAQRKAAAAGGASGPVSPDSITTPQGQTFTPVVDSAPPPPAVNSAKFPGTCETCKRPIRKGKRYCSQRCAGKGTAATRKTNPTRAHAPHP